MDLCQECTQLSAAISNREAYSLPEAFWTRTIQKATGCRLCKMMSDYIYDNAVDVVEADSFSRSNRLNKIFYRSFENVISTQFISCLGFEFNSQSNVEMSVWSEPGSAASLSGAICSYPPLPSDNCTEAFSLVNHWIQTCRDGHEACRWTISGDLVDEDNGPKLPTRVLDIGKKGDTSISLVETAGQRGNYCALSYCWGSAPEQHLRTTKHNINIHYHGINLGSMPKTFRDAIDVTREIGIRFLWIDSLCIVQGDKADWAAEASQMAEVYQNAYLIIAASGATNPQGGCFSNKIRTSSSVQVPYFEAGEIKGSFRLSMRTQGNQSPQYGPLRKRAWAFQEWHLSRRTLHFMPSGMSWKCRELQTSERYPYDIQQYSRWSSILHAYSDCQLTYPEDNLPALHGLAMAHQKETGDRYRLGVFESGLPEQLLWMSRTKAHIPESLEDIPSWSWASKDGPKSFQMGRFMIKESLIDSSRISIDNSGTLKLQGFVTECIISIVRDNESDKLKCPYLKFCTEELQKDTTEPLHWIEFSPRISEFAGICAFDMESYGRAHLVLVNTLDYTFVSQVIIGEALPCPSKEHYAALILVPATTQVNVFRRVGMGYVTEAPEEHLSISNTFQAISII